MPNKNGGEPPAEGEALAETQPTLRGVFRDVYGFVLQAVKGDKATADAVFEDYLAGKLSEELLSISRRCVSKDQARWMVDQQQYNRPMAHFGLFNGRFAIREDIVFPSADQDGRITARPRARASLASDGAIKR